MLILPDLIKKKTEINPYRLSDSTLRTVHRCEKLFQLVRLCKVDSDERETSPAAIRGNAFGVGVQTYMLTGDLNEAIIACWLAYWPMDEERPKVSAARTINNLIAIQATLDKLRERYEVAVFDGKPAIELSFRLNKQGSKWHYVGYVDIVLYDKQEKIYVVFELKTTSYKLTDLEAVYKNQEQALAYSIVLDKIAGEKQSTYGVLYLVVRDKDKDFVPDIYLFSFKKTLVDRLKWFFAYGLELERLDKMLEMDLFPMRGHACVTFNRVCGFYNNCQLESLTQNKRKEPEKEETYQFVYDLDEIVQDHLERVEKQLTGDLETI